ncbi:Hypothetical protein, putative [Bodo saltans]|uniref:Uncharacterized protein n=1 Tax=Bodo saltans TaxID=75058 RepID=A0A0S4IK85_BODSA|nr:Hypothetical protein, putative [Bodo saltans]|eukprot:CUE56143.1 Hypothetical protein, putative [Bodo saltans]
MKKLNNNNIFFSSSLPLNRRRWSHRQRDTDHTPLYVTCALCHVFVDRFFVRTRVVCLASPNFNTHAFLSMNEELTVNDSYLPNHPDMHKK